MNNTEINTQETFFNVQIYSPSLKKILEIRSFPFKYFYILSCLLFPVYGLGVVLLIVTLAFNYREQSQIGKAKRLTQTSTEPAILDSNIKNAKLPSSLNTWIKRQAYWNFLNQILDDGRITAEEERKSEGWNDYLKNDPLLPSLKIEFFKTIYLNSILDQRLSHEEEATLNAVENLFGLDASFIEEEKSTLRRLIEVRKVESLPLEVFSPPIRFSSSERCYHQTQARLLEKQILRSYRQDNQKFQETGLVLKKEGDCYITSKRIVLISDGTMNIPLEKIFDIEVDINNNLITFSKDGREKPYYLSVPDTLLFGAKVKAALKLIHG